MKLLSTKSSPTVMHKETTTLPTYSTEGGSIYLNFPFCTRRCSFCHYVPNLIFGNKSIPEEYVRLLTEQLGAFIKTIAVPRKFSSCTFGGGSPSLLSLQQIQEIQQVFTNYDITFQEVSIEIHPQTWNPEYLALKFFNRYSIGVQSFDTDWMQMHNRFFTTFDSISHIVQEIQSHTPNVQINIDLVFDSTFPVTNFQLAASLNPDIVTVYPLTRQRRFSEINNLYQEVINTPEICSNYWRISENSFIFQKESNPNSLYIRDGMVYLNDIYGFGHNGKSSIGKFQYLSQYDRALTKWNFIKNAQNRYWNTLFFSLPFGVNQMILDKADAVVKQFLLPAVNPDFNFLPYKNIPEFYEYLQQKSSREFERVFFQALCYGSNRPDDFPIPAIS